MNFMLTRSNHRHVNSGWEPFATSTPLKTAPNNVNIEKESWKKLQICTDSVDIIRKLQKSYSAANVPATKTSDLKHLESKRPRKNKSCANFDLSSSSDDESSSEKKRPIIKLSFKKQTNSLHKSIRLNKANSKEHKTSSASDSTSTCTDLSQKSKKDLKQNFGSVQTSNNKQKQSSILNNSISDDDRQIFDVVKDSSNAVSNLESKENTEKLIKNVKNLSNCEFKVTKSGNTSQNKQKTHSHVEHNSLISKNFEKTKIKNKVSKRKCKLTENTIKTTRSRKAKDLLRTPLNGKPKDNPLTPIHLVENKTNISHQLFSDTREQELINVLDLTSGEVNEPKESQVNYFCKDKSKLSCRSLTSPHPSNYKNPSEEKKENEPRRKLNFKKNQVKNVIEECLPVTDANKQSQLEKNVKIFSEKDENIEIPKVIKKTNVVCSSEKTNVFTKEFLENNVEVKDLKQRKIERKAKKNIPCKIKKNKETLAPDKAADSNTKTNGERKALQSTEGITENQCVKDGEIPSIEKPVFKLLNKLDYKEDEKGCSAIECWDINTFKCGVFKLKIKSQMNCRTAHANSHLGGVLVKGNIRMKIGNRELELSQGDMAFVPPLTDWQATNIGECESIFYYWCGRFKV